MQVRPHALRVGILAVLLAACTSVDVATSGPAGGTVHTRSTALRFLWREWPTPALSRAREAAFDLRLDGYRTTRVQSWPDGGPLDAVLGLLFFRVAEVHGEYGI